MSLKAETLLKSGQNPELACEQALAFAEKNLDMNGGDASVYNTMGMVHFLRARYVGSQGGNPRESFQDAIAILEKGLERQSRFTALHSNLGLAHLYLFQTAADISPQAMDHYHHGVLHLEKARQLMPSWMPTLINLGAAHWILGEAQFFAGEDPRDAFCKAQEAFETILHWQPDHHMAHLNLGNTLQLFGEYLWEHRQPSAFYFQTALDHFEQAIQKNPRALEAHMGKGISFLNLAKEAWISGQLPDGFVHEALTAVDQALHLRPNWDMGLFNLAMIQMWQMRFQSGREKAPDSIMLDAEETARELLRSHSQNADAWIILGELKRFQGPASVAQSRRYFLKALEIDPHNGFGYLGLARLQLESLAEGSHDPAWIQGFLDEGDWLLTMALRGGAPLQEVAQLRGLIYLLQARCQYGGNSRRTGALNHALEYAQRQSLQAPHDAFFEWLRYELQILSCGIENQRANQKDGLSEHNRILRELLGQNPYLRHWVKRFSWHEMERPALVRTMNYL